jgi:hypothetical protein
MVQNTPAHAVHLQQGFNNPEYKSTQQDLTDEKRGEDSGMQAQGIQGKALARIKVFCRKAH